MIPWSLTLHPLLQQGPCADQGGMEYLEFSWNNNDVFNLLEIGPSHSCKVQDGSKLGGIRNLPVNVIQVIDFLYFRVFRGLFRMALQLLRNQIRTMNLYHTTALFKRGASRKNMVLFRLFQNSRLLPLVSHRHLSTTSILLSDTNSEEPEDDGDEGELNSEEVFLEK